MRLPAERCVQRAAQKAISYQYQSTCYLGIVAYWLSFLVCQQIIMCFRDGGWTDFDLHDHLTMIFLYLAFEQ